MNPELVIACLKFLDDELGFEMDLVLKNGDRVTVDVNETLRYAIEVLNRSRWIPVNDFHAIEFQTVLAQDSDGDIDVARLTDTGIWVDENGNEIPDVTYVRLMPIPHKEDKS